MQQSTSIRGLSIAALLAAAAQAQLKWEGCPDLAASQLKKTILVGKSANGSTPGTTVVDAGLNEPVKMSIAGNGDVYIAERGGSIKRWRAGALKTIGKLSVFTGGSLSHATQKSNENGLHGIALDPDFASNNWVYLHYAPLTPSVIRISRFTLAGDALDPASEKKLLDIPVQRNSCCHTGGGMEFDLNGNLFVTVGNNTTNPGPKAPDAYLKESDPDADDQGHAANTNDLRGKLLRIKPKPDGTYEVPEGNLFPKGTDKARPEIWAMGMRNPYSLSLDKYRGWAGWGDVGPDDGLADSEEWNLLTKPANAGWPYFVGANTAWRPALGKVASAPVNNSPNNTGLKTLPPAVPATIGYGQSCAVSGPVFYYNGASPSKTMLPPHLNKKWLVSDWWKGNLEAVTLSEDGATVLGRTTLMPHNTLNGPLDFKIGPDGALYVVEYGQTSGGLWFTSANNTAISRIEYSGTCHPAEPVPPTLASGVRESGLMGTGTSTQNTLIVSSTRKIGIPDGVRGLRLFDIHGRTAWRYQVTGNENGTLILPESLRTLGVLRVQYLR